MRSSTSRATATALLATATLFLGTGATTITAFEEDFDGYYTTSFSGTDDWASHYSSDSWSTFINGGVYSVTDSGGGTWGSGGAIDNALTWEGEAFSDFTLDLDLYSNDDDSLGVVFRYTDEDNFYLFLLSGGDNGPATGTGGNTSLTAGVYLYAVSSGSATLVDSDTTVTFTEGDTHAVQVIADGTSFEVWFDDGADGIDSADQVFSFSDSTHTSGYVGFYCYDNGWGGLAWGACSFDNIVVTLDDTDEDGVADPDDNCVDDANADQADLDGDGLGDVCDDDVDGDGYDGDVDDCDDEDATIHPGATEVCDGVDQDCDTTVDEGTECYDDDEDGYTEDDGDCDDADATSYPGGTEVCDGADNDCDGTVDETTSCYDDDGDGVTEDDGDCDDDDATSYPGGTEVCDGADNDCDGTVDEGTSCYDDDGDGVTEDDGDCDDADATLYPGATEVCDGVDQDCDGTADDGTSCYDDDGDGVTEDDGDCDDADATAFPGGTEICDGADDDCNGVIDDGTECYDDDGDGFTELDGDCDDGEAAVNPDAEERCNGVDDDCNGNTDEPSAVDSTRWYPDDDDDGHGADVDPIVACDAPDGHVASSDDCDDTVATIHPDADEYCNGVDDDCDLSVDEPDAVDALVLYTDADGDSWGDDATELRSCDPIAGRVERGGDCDDADADVNPAVEEVPGDGIDQDCDGFDGAAGDGSRTWTEPERGEVPEVGCGCAVTPTPGASWLGLVLLGILARRRHGQPLPSRR